MSGKKKNMKDDDSDPDVSSESDSDFEDPDKIEVPGNLSEIILLKMIQKLFQNTKIYRRGKGPGNCCECH